MLKSKLHQQKTKVNFIFLSNSIWKYSQADSAGGITKRKGVTAGHPFLFALGFSYVRRNRSVDISSIYYQAVINNKNL